MSALFTAPDGPPQDVTLEPTSPQSIKVSWKVKSKQRRVFFPSAETSCCHECMIDSCKTDFELNLHYYMLIFYSDPKKASNHYVEANHDLN